MASSSIGAVLLKLCLVSGLCDDVPSKDSVRLCFESFGRWKVPFTVAGPNVLLKGRFSESKTCRVALGVSVRPV